MSHCGFCDKNLNFSQYIKHLKQFHLLKDGDNLKCFRHCAHKYSSFSGLKYHINFYHKIASNLNDDDTRGSIMTCDTSSDIQMDFPHEDQLSKIDVPLDINKRNHDFILYLYNLHLPESVIKSIVSYSNLNIQEIIDRVQTSTCKECHANLETNFMSLNINEGSCFNWRQTIFNQYGIVKPVDIQIGTRIENKFDRSVYRMVPRVVSVTATYIPLLSQLRFLLKNEEISHWIKTSSKSSDGTLTCFEDGKKFSVHPLFSKEISLRLNLFYDEFECANALGSKATIHKIGAVYFCLDNLPRKLNSKLQNIFVALLFHSQDIKEFGFDVILRPLVDDLKVLEKEGIDVDWSEQKIKGSIALFSADNLGANAIYGFVESFVANYFCRICTVDKKSSYTLVEEDPMKLRTKDQHLANIERNIVENSVHTEGVKSNSILNELLYFNCVENQTVDIMHDALEGIVQYELKLVLNSLSQGGVFTEYTIRTRIHSFDYGRSDSANRPISFSLAKSGNDLGLSAAQSWCLVRNILFMIAFEVQPNNRYLRLIIMLVKIMQFIFAPRLTLLKSYELSQLIKAHHTHFLAIYKEKHLLPKHHFMVHYPRIIREYGNLINFWCMRYEAKHHVFVKLANKIQNFKNITLSLAMRHQLDLAHSFTISEPSILREFYSPVRIKQLAQLNISGELKRQLHGNANIQTYNWVKYDFVKHHVGSYVFLGINVAEEFEFGEILYIFQINYTLTFCVLIWKSMGLNDLYQSYPITSTTYQRIVKAADIKDYQSFNIKHSLDGTCSMKYISSKHILI